MILILDFKSSGIQRSISSLNYSTKGDVSAITTTQGLYSKLVFSLPLTVVFLVVCKIWSKLGLFNTSKKAGIVKHKVFPEPPGAEPRKSYLMVLSLEFKCKKM